MKEDINDYGLEHMLREYVQETIGKNEEMNEELLREYVENALRSFNEVEDTLQELDENVRIPDGLMFRSLPKHVLNETYITGVLGISIPLNESYPYSADLQERIIHEHLIFEGFFSKVAGMAGDAKTIMVAFKKIAQDPASASQYVASINSSVIGGPFKKIIEFLKLITTKVKEWGIKALTKVVELAESGMAKLEEMWKSASGGDGWKTALKISGFALGVMWIWKNFGKIITSGTAKIKEIAGKIAKMVTGGTNEAYTLNLSLLDVYDADIDRIDEFLGLGKKKKGSGNIKHSKTAKNIKKAEDTVAKLEKKKKKIEKKIEKAEEREEQARELLGDDEDEDAEGGEEEEEQAHESLEDDEVPEGVDPESVTEESAGLIRNAIGWFNENIKDALFGFFKDLLPSLATDLIAGAVSGGAATFISGAKKLFKGIGFVTSTLGPALEKFTDREKKKGGEDKEKKEEKNEALLRQVVRETLFRAKLR